MKLAFRTLAVPALSVHSHVSHRRTFSGNFSVVRKFAIQFNSSLAQCTKHLRGRISSVYLPLLKNFIFYRIFFNLQHYDKGKLKRFFASHWSAPKIYEGLNPLTTNVPIIQKSVSWFALQIVSMCKWFLCDGSIGR